MPKVIVAKDTDKQDLRDRIEGFKQNCTDIINGGTPTDAQIKKLARSVRTILRMADRRWL